MEALQDVAGEGLHLDSTGPLGPRGSRVPFLQGPNVENSRATLLGLEHEEERQVQLDEAVGFRQEPPKASQSLTNTPPCFLIS